jgi:hypothetical protein
MYSLSDKPMAEYGCMSRTVLAAKRVMGEGAREGQRGTCDIEHGAVADFAEKHFLLQHLDVERGACHAPKRHTFASDEVAGKVLLHPAVPAR